jgi:hypothetical protein
MEDELGHFETCSSVTNQLPFSATQPGQSFSDPNVFQTCVGGSEGPGPRATGEGPCTVNGSGALKCKDATTEDDVSCKHGDSACELSDALCMPAGARLTNLDGQTQEVSWPIAGCQANFFQNGDLDFDGTSYQSDWPDGSPLHPSSFQYIGPFDGNGQLYPEVQMETDVAASENDCNTVTGAGCTALPVGANFYPYWTIGQTGGTCTWNFGNTIPGVTVQNFGGDLEYGTPDVARFGGTLTSPLMPNPEFSVECGTPSVESALALMH